MQLVLYGKPGCHLCAEAHEALASAGLLDRVEELDITRSNQLKRTFGTRILVLARKDTGETLDWPFGPADIGQFVRR